MNRHLTKDNNFTIFTRSRKLPGKMKKLLSALLLVTVFFLSANAETIDADKAKIAGRNFLSHHGAVDKTIELVFTGSSEGETLYYIFNYDQGFVIVSADDRIIPVLGYSTEGPWVVPTDTITGNNVLGWMKQYEQQIKSEVRKAIGEGRRASSEVRSPQTAVGPLLTTTWNQTWPYNALCPSGALAGCVAVALAQIMKYHNYPSQGLGSYGYLWGGYPLTFANFGGTTYNWANMPNSTSSGNNDIATIIYHAAVSCRAMWGAGSTGVYVNMGEDPMTRALWNFFRYSFSTIQYIEKINYTDSEWDNVIQAELVASRPVYYRGDGSMSHAWVCDGVDASNYYHFNWGWGGLYNGFFALSSINPGGNNVTNNQHAIIGIKPNDGSTIVSNTTWAGNVTRNTSVAIPDSITVTVNPGTVIQFAQNCELRVSGRLLSVGDSLHYVKFTASNPSLGWNGIKWWENYLKIMSDNQQSQLIYTQVEHSKSSGIFCRAFGKVLVSHCKINNNDAGYGGGLSIWYNPVKIENSEIYNNHCTIQGGGFFMCYTDTMSANIDHNDVHDNISDGGGGGFCLSGVSSVALRENIFHTNQAPKGSGGEILSGSPKIINSKFCNNISASPGKGALYTENCNSLFSDILFANNYRCGFYFDQNSSPYCINFDIANNEAQFYGGGGIIVNNSNPTFKNAIFRGNVAGVSGNQIYISTSNCDPFFDHCNIQGGLAGFGGPGSGSNYTISNYTNNIDSDPLFVNPTAGSGTGYNGLTADWHLQPGSPCIDAGTPDTTGLYLPATDVYGSPRVFNNRVDIGAAENQCNPPAQPSVISGNTTPVQFSSQNYSVTNTPGVSYSWTFPDGWVQTEGGTTNSVTAIVGLNPGNISVTPFNSACSGLARTLAVTPKTLFVTPMTWGVPGTAGGKPFNIIASGSWSASSDQPWCGVTSSGSGSGTIASNWTANPSTTDSRTAHLTFTATGLDPVIVTIIQAGSQFKVLNTKAYLESLYFAGGVMRQAMDENGPHSGTGIADQVTVELIDTMNYTHIVYSKSNVNLSIAGDISIVDIPMSYPDNSRLKISHRNSIETVSYYSIDMHYSTNEYYDFTTDPFFTWGNNVKVVSGKCLFWGGDVNQDGIVDSGDMNLIDNGSSAVMLGYNPEDVNGDGIVDSGDMNLTDNNNTAVIIAILP
jgi:hypothetical protein